MIIIINILELVITRLKRYDLGRIRIARGIATTIETGTETGTELWIVEKNAAPRDPRIAIREEDHKIPIDKSARTRLGFSIARGTPNDLDPLRDRRI